MVDVGDQQVRESLTDGAFENGDDTMKITQVIMLDCLQYDKGKPESKD